MTVTSQILARSDAGEHPDAIASSLQVALSTVYATLREYRPNRERKPRARTGSKRLMIKELARLNTPAADIVDIVKCSRAYVYAVLNNHR